MEAGAETCQTREWWPFRLPASTAREPFHRQQQVRAVPQTCTPAYQLPHNTATQRALLPWQRLLTPSHLLKAKTDHTGATNHHAHDGQEIKRTG